MYGYGQCGRCGGWAMEHLATHSHCWECNYFPEENNYQANNWHELEHLAERLPAQRKRNSIITQELNKRNAEPARPRMLREEAL